jgi:hypothetical protein
LYLRGICKWRYYKERRNFRTTQKGDEVRLSEKKSDKNKTGEKTASKTLKVKTDKTTISSGIPTVKILSLANNALFEINRLITFRGEAQDPEDGQLSGASLEWFSDRDGSLGTGNEISTALSGPSCSFVPHTITLKARDSDGNIGSSNIVVSVGRIC